jgi:transcriptional regulator with XRE-family HTH domain
MGAAQAVSIRNRIIGILVKRARQKADKSQRECASLLRCSPATFNQYEQGERGLSLPQLETLAYLLGVPLISLWDDDFTAPEAPLKGTLPLEQLTLLRRKMLAVQLRQYRQAAGLSRQDLAKALGCSANKISEYERGNRDIPVAELEIVAERCHKDLDDFLDDQAIPLSPAERDRRALAQLNELTPEVREFVLNPSNALYVRIAMQLSAMKADSLRHIAEIILDITY